MRDVTKDIWRTVVVAGAMLGSTACGSAQKTPEAAAPVAPEAESAPATTTEGDAPEGADEAAKKKAPVVAADAGPPDAAPAPPDAAPTPDAAPAKRPRKGEGRPSGRGFIVA